MRHRYVNHEGRAHHQCGHLYPLHAIPQGVRGSRDWEVRRVTLSVQGKRIAQRPSEPGSRREEAISRRPSLAMRGLTFSVAAVPAISAALFGSVHPWAYWTIGSLTIALALSAR